MSTTAGTSPQPYPSRDTLVTEKRKATREFDEYLTELERRVGSVSQIAGSVNVDAGGAGNVALTPIGDSDQGAGGYALGAYAQILIADPVSSSFQLSISWLYNGVAQTETFAALVNGTPTTHQSVGLPRIQHDGGPISYQVTYASNTPGLMQFGLFMTLQALPGGL